MRMMNPGLKSSWVTGWDGMDGWMDGWMNEWMDE